MSITRRGVRAVGRLTATAGGALCLAWVAQASAPVPRVLGVKPASCPARCKFKIIV